MGSNGERIVILYKIVNSESDGDDSDSGEGKVSTPSSALFHRDDSGKVTFTAKEADAASDFIASMDFEERVKACKFCACSMGLVCCRRIAAGL